ncbi:TfoX/Sxy family DNA transformation protein [Nonomuraea monospora]
MREPGQLAGLGAVEVFRRLRDAAVPGLSLNALWALEGAPSSAGRVGPNPSGQRRVSSYGSPNKALAQDLRH